MLDSARAYLAHKAGSIRRPNGKYLLRQEARLGAKTYRRFKAQQAWLLVATKSLSFFAEAKGVRRIETKTAYEDIDAILDDLPFQEDMVDDIVATARATYKKGAVQGVEELNMGKFGISFDLVNDEAVAYLEKLKTLQLSDFRGSINRQTKDKIRRILVESAETGRSYTETSKLIAAQGEAGVFSRARGELIAVNQTGRAYGQGNMDMVDAFRTETGSIVQKFWQTVDDDRVTAECATNEEQGWIGYDDAFLSGDENAPREDNPRCRCVTTFRTVDTRGNPT